MEIQLSPVLDALLSNKGLQAISDAAAEVLENPFWIVDLNSTHLTSLSGESSDENLIHEKETGYVQDETLDYLAQNRIREQINRSAEPVIFTAPGTDKRILSCAARIGSSTIASVSTIEENRCFSEEDFQLIKTIAQIVSTELQKDSFYRDNKEMMYSYFLSDLLENRMFHEDMKKRLRKIGYQTKEFFYLLTVEPEYLEHRNIVLNSLHGQLKYILKDCIYCLYNNRSVFLVTRKRKFVKDDPLLKRLCVFLENSDLKAALSDAFRDIAEVPAHYEKSIDSIRLGKQSKPSEVLYSYSALATSHMLELIREKISYHDFCSDAIGKLERFDRETHADLTETLLCYLENNFKIVPAANALCLHSNTMRYRLEKIKEITECELTNGHQCFDLMLALKLRLHTAVSAF